MDLDWTRYGRMQLVADQFTEIQERDPRTMGSSTAHHSPNLGLKFDILPLIPTLQYSMVHLKRHFDSGQGRLQAFTVIEDSQVNVSY